MAKQPGGKRVFPTVTFDQIRRLNQLIPYRMSESITARSDKLAKAVLTKFLGPEWREKHTELSKKAARENLWVV
jgi:hypothetical protein